MNRSEKEALSLLKSHPSEIVITDSYVSTHLPGYLRNRVNGYHLHHEGFPQPKFLIPLDSHF